MDPGDLVLETDCPYLTPVPHRGERNESAYVRYVCEAVARILELDPAQVARMTSETAARIFGPARAAIEEPAAGQTTAGQTTAGQATAGQATPGQTAAGAPAAREDRTGTNA